jgi:hypothetical protein
MARYKISKKNVNEFFVCLIKIVPTQKRNRILNKLNNEKIKSIHLHFMPVFF